MNFKSLKDVIDYYQAPERFKDNADLLRVLTETQQQLIDTQKSALEVLNNIRALDLENEELRKKLTRRDEYILEKTVFWLKNDLERNQPFCPSCYAKGLAIPLQKYWQGRQKTNTLWSCPNKECEQTYNPWDHKEY